MCASFCRSTSLKRRVRAGGLEGRLVLAPFGAGAVVPAFGFEHLSPTHVPSFVQSSSPPHALSEQEPCARDVKCDGALAGFALKGPLPPSISFADRLYVLM